MPETSDGARGRVSQGWGLNAIVTHDFDLLLERYLNLGAGILALLYFDNFRIERYFEEDKRRSYSALRCP